MQDADDLNFGRINPCVVDAVLDGPGEEDHVFQADGVPVSIPAIRIKIEYHLHCVQCDRHINALTAQGLKFEDNL